MRARTRKDQLLLMLPVLALAAGCGWGGVGSPAESVEIQEAHVNYSWSGWDARGYTLNVMCQDDSCRATSTCSVGQPHITVTNEPAMVDADKVAALGVITSGLRPVDGPQEVIEHADDYPDFDIRLVTADREVIEVTSTSNTQKNLPWNVRRDDQWFVNEGEQFPDAYADLLKDISPTGCWG
jgi:hypothetical protein